MFNLGKRIAMFAKFLSLGKKNYSNEILAFYLKTINSLKNKNFHEGFTKVSTKSDDECILTVKAIETFRELFEGLIPFEIYGLLKQKIE